MGRVRHDIMRDITGKFPRHLDDILRGSTSMYRKKMGTYLGKYGMITVTSEHGYLHLPIVVEDISKLFDVLQERAIGV